MFYNYNTLVLSVMIIREIHVFVRGMDFSGWTLFLTFFFIFRFCPPTDDACKFSNQNSTGPIFSQFTTLKTLTWWYRVASGEWLACVAYLAATYRTMINDTAFCVQAASADTRICAFLFNTSLSKRTLGTDRAFRATSRRASIVIGQTRAYCLLVCLPTLAIRATGWGVARILGHSRRYTKIEQLFYKRHKKCRDSLRSVGGTSQYLNGSPV